MTRLIVRNGISKRYPAKRAHPRPRRLIVNERERDKDYDANYIGAGNTGRAKAKNDNGALSRIKPGDAPAYVCERCDLSRMTLVQLRAHYRKFHGDRS